jgi:tyrosine-specific transport protein
MFSISVVIFGNYQMNFEKAVFEKDFNLKGTLYILPIIFTSFGVQNVCPHICKILKMDMKLIKRAFLIGICIPAFVYISLIYVVVQAIYKSDPMLFERMFDHQVEVGELITKLCEFSKFNFINIIFKMLTLFAIITSAIGIGIGLMYSLKTKVTERLKNSLPIILVAIPVIVTCLIPNAFMNILSFGGAIVTIFVIFIPIYLMFNISKRESINFKYFCCILYGAVIILSEIFG